MAHKDDESPMIVQLSETLELRTALLQRTLTLLQRVDRLIPKTSHMTHEDQETMREAHALLVECGMQMPPVDRVWVDRVCICEPVKLADGTNASGGGRIVNAACVLHGMRL